MNIEEYEFVDDDVQEGLQLKYKSMVGLYFKKDIDIVCIHKRDVIALAKHFRLTPSDIEDDTK